MLLFCVIFFNIDIQRVMASCASFGYSWNLCKVRFVLSVVWFFERMVRLQPVWCFIWT